MLSLCFCIKTNSMSLELTQLNTTQKEDLRAALGLGDAATADINAFATAAQGAKADSAVIDVDVPSSHDDFSMFAGSIAPVSGSYRAKDNLHEYTIDGGDSVWKRSRLENW